jgi:hypothetical protein
MRPTNEPERTGRERRRAPRATVNFPIELTYRDETRSGALVDLSEIGLCCTYPIAIDELTQVRLVLDLPGVAERIPVEGAVVRCEKRRGETPPTYEIALYFTRIENDARSRVRSFVHGRLGANV